MKWNKTTLLTIALAVALLAALIFGIMYGKQVTGERRRTNELCTFYSQAAYDSIVIYRDTGNEMYYYAALTDFYSFLQLHFYDRYDTGDYTNANELYWKMQAAPDAVQKYTEELVVIFGLLKSNPYHPNAYQKIASLNNRVLG